MISTRDQRSRVKPFEEVDYATNKSVQQDVGEESKMGGDFSLGEGNEATGAAGGVGAAVVTPAGPQAGGDVAVTLDKKVSEEQLRAEARRQAELAEIKRQQMELLKKAEDVERKYSGSKESIVELWDRAIKDVIKIYHQGEEMSGLKKAVYDMVGFVTIGYVDMYKREANGILRSARQKAERIKRKLDYIHRKLYNEHGQKGLAVLLKEQREIATAKANALAKSRQANEEYTTELKSKEAELRAIETKMEADPETDYSDELELKRKDIADLKAEYGGIDEDIRGLSNTLHLYDAKVETKDAIVRAINVVYTKGMRAYTDLDSQIQIAQEFIDEGRLIDQGLGQAIQELEAVVEMTGALVGMETRLGETIVEGTRQITDKMKGVQGMVRDKTYLEELKVEANEDEQELTSNTDKLIKKYATVGYK